MGLKGEEWEKRSGKTQNSQNHRHYDEERAAYFKVFMLYLEYSGAARSGNLLRSGVQWNRDLGTFDRS